MQLSAKTQNACLAVLELARRHESSHPVCLKAIAEAHALSPQFLVQILLQLKRAGIVTSTRGASGGYRLAQSPEAISLLDVVLAIEGPPAKWSVSGESPLGQALIDHWDGIVERFQRRLGEITLRQLIEVAESSVAADMYYI